MNSIRHAQLHIRLLLTLYLQVWKTRPDIVVGEETMVLCEFTTPMIERVAGKHGRGRDEAGDGMVIDTLIVTAARWI